MSPGPRPTIGVTSDVPRREVSFAGCRVRYYRTATLGGTPLLLVHGGGGHVGWWDDVVPRRGRRFDLVVPDLSGHGESGHRDGYTPELWAGELAAILREEDEPAARLLGYSMGGQVGIFVAALHPDRTDALVLADPGLREPDDARGREPRGRGWRPTSVYPTEEEAVARFRLAPGETSASPEVLRQVARQGLRPVPTGWTWRFDPRVSRRFTDTSLHAALARVACPVGINHGQKSVVAGADTVAYVASRIGQHVPSIVVEDAHHHVPLDRPEACADAIARMIDMLTAPVPCTVDPPTSTVSTRKR